jgi:hypothetical protein
MTLTLNNEGRITNLIEISKKLTTKLVESAIATLVNSRSLPPSYEASTHYDLVIGETRFPPKAVFGLAMSELLGEAVTSNHFTGGAASICHKRLAELGFDIQKKRIERENEQFDFTKLIVGAPYTRMSAIEAGEARKPHQARDITGRTKFKNCNVLFVTLDKENSDTGYQYNDVFLLDGKEFYWESKASDSINTKGISDMIKGLPTILFARVRDKLKGKTLPFLYVGQLKFNTHENDQPVHVLFENLDHKATPNAELNSIYMWEKHQGWNFELPTSIPNIIASRKRSGQGRMVDAKKRKAIELHAMKLATNYYEKKGYEVVDTSSNCPYDLECLKGEDCRRIEVKGTTSDGMSVYVTVGEVEDALSDYCETDLFIVSNIQIQLIGTSKTYKTQGGNVNLIDNWRPHKNDLEPKTFKYNVRCD